MSFHEPMSGSSSGGGVDGGSPPGGHGVYGPLTPGPRPLPNDRTNSRPRSDRRRRPGVRALVEHGDRDAEVRDGGRREVVLRLGGPPADARDDEGRRRDRDFRPVSHGFLPGRIGSFDARPVPAYPLRARNAA